jgi:anthranilate phosphoribosyltransferase
MLRVKAPPNAVDVVGTRQRWLRPVNVSTCACFIVAGAGVPVANTATARAFRASGRPTY